MVCLFPWVGCEGGKVAPGREGSSNLVVMDAAPESDLRASTSSLYRILVGWPQISNRSFLDLSFFVCKISMMTVPIINFINC